jgi:hypothetical protein
MKHILHSHLPSWAREETASPRSLWGLHLRPAVNDGHRQCHLYAIEITQGFPIIIPLKERLLQNDDMVVHFSSFNRYYINNVIDGRSK